MIVTKNGKTFSFYAAETDVRGLLLSQCLLKDPLLQTFYNIRKNSKIISTFPAINFVSSQRNEYLELIRMFKMETR